MKFDDNFRKELCKKDKTLMMVVGDVIDCLVILYMI